MKRKHVLRIVLTLIVTGLALAYIFWKIDIGETAHILANADPYYFALSVAIAFLTVPPMAWRWKLLLRAKGIHDNLPWLTRAYFVSYSASQMLPTSVGGDAVRIYETAKRHPGRGGPSRVDRAGAGARRRRDADPRRGRDRARVRNYDIGIYLWVELAFVVATVLAGIVLFSKTVRPLLRRFVPVLKKLWVERHVRAVYEGIHSYRHNAGLLIFVTAVTLLIQAGRVVSIWAGAEAVGVDLSIRPYFALGPLLFLVMLVPFTLNGVAVRESFFVSFLGKLGISADEAFAAGFVFFLVTIALALPGVAIWGFESPCAGATLAPRSGAKPNFHVRWSRPPSPSSSRTTGCRGSSAASRASPATRRSWSTTARPTGRWSSCASGFPRRRSSSRRTGASAPGSTAACAASDADYYLLVNSDAWLLGDAVDRLVDFAEGMSGVAVVGPRLRNLDGSIQRSVRGFPTLWRSRPSTSSCASSRRARKR